MPVVEGHSGDCPRICQRVPNGNVPPGTYNKAAVIKFRDRQSRVVLNSLLQIDTELVHKTHLKKPSSNHPLDIRVGINPSSYSSF